MRTVAIVACSNGLKPEFASQNEELFSYFKIIILSGQSESQ